MGVPLIHRYRCAYDQSRVVVDPLHVSSNLAECVQKDALEYAQKLVSADDCAVFTPLLPTAAPTAIPHCRLINSSSGQTPVRSVPF